MNCTRPQAIKTFHEALIVVLCKVLDGQDLEALLFSANCGEEKVKNNS
jgi:hypothetical protein